jgi:hypothetical protein
VTTATELCLTVERRTAAGTWRPVEGSLRARVPRGTATLRFSGRLAGRALSPGRHRLRLSAVAHDGRRQSRLLRFAITR